MKNFHPSLHRFALLARRCPTLLAGPLTLYQEQEHLTDKQLAARLGCSVESLHRLALCERPRADSNFHEDVIRIAEYIQADTLQLAMVIRAAESREALRQPMEQSTMSHALLAARDNEEETPHE